MTQFALDANTYLMEVYNTLKPFPPMPKGKGFSRKLSRRPAIGARSTSFQSRVALCCVIGVDIFLHLHEAFYAVIGVDMILPLHETLCLNWYRHPCYTTSPAM